MDILLNQMIHIPLINTKNVSHDVGWNTLSAVKELTHRSFNHVPFYPNIHCMRQLKNRTCLETYDDARSTETRLHVDSLVHPECADPHLVRAAHIS